MFSPRDAVLDEIGDKFTAALVHAIAAARSDLADMRAWRPSWFPGMFQREIAGVLHSRIWAGLQGELDGLPGFELVTKEPFRVVRIWTPLGRTYSIRVKRHNTGDHVSSYPTSSDGSFWSGGAATFEGMEEVNLAAGYRWDSDTGTVGEPVVSYREGKSNVIWAVALEQSGEAGQPLHRTPLPPTLPWVDLAEGLDEEEADETQ